MSEVSVLLMAAIIGLVCLAAVLQRFTGMGFAMMLAPFLVVMIGPHAGVMLTNLLSLIAPLLMLPVVWKDVEWRRLAWIAPPAVLVMPLGGWITSVSPQGPLYIVVASLVILGLSTSIIVSRITGHIDGPATRILAGVGTGGGVVLAGVGGPAMAIYSVLCRWNPVKFAATLQPLWALMAALGFTTNYVFNGNEIPALTWWFWAGSMVSILVGMWIGTKVRGMISHRVARKVVIGLAFVGAVLALITGIQAL